MSEPSDTVSLSGRKPEVRSLSGFIDTLPPVDAVLLREGVFLRPVRMVAPPGWIPHIPFAFWMVDALKPTTFVELGTHSGNSYSAFVQAVQAFELGTACNAVDTWERGAHAGLIDESVFTEWAAFHDRHFSTFSRLVRSTFDEARSMFADRSLDLLHIDGLHTYDAVRHDFESWLPKVSARGVVLLHNINVRQGDFGVWRFWEEIRDRYPTFAFLHGHGLGIVAVGPDVPSDVRWLVGDLPRLPKEASRVQQFFAGLGGLLERDWSIAQLERERRELTRSQNELADRLGALEGSARQPAVAPEVMGTTVAARIAEFEYQNDKPRDDEEDTPDEAPDESPAKLRHERDRLLGLAAELERERVSTETEATALRVAAVTAVREHQVAKQALRAVTRELKTIRASRTWRLTSRLHRLRGLGLAPLFQARGLRSTVATLRAALRPHRLLEIRRVVLSGLFDERYYRSRYDDVRRSGAVPVVHYVMAGACEGRNPHPLFDGKFYLERYADIRAAGANPLLHYIQVGPTERHRDPHPLFSTVHYLTQHPDLVSIGTNPLLHYLSADRNEAASPHPLFNPQFYLEQNSGALNEGIDPLIHFIEHGGREGRASHPLFDTAFYLRQNADVRSAGVNPLVHYLEHVPGEDRDPHPLFDSSFYLDAAPDLVTLGINPLVHFVEHGWREGRRPNAAFDPLWYLEMYPDVAASGQNPLEHFARLGWREGRDPSPEFSTREYVAAHPDTVASGTNPLYHYLLHGAREGRAVKRSDAPSRRLPPSAPATLRVHGEANPHASLSAPTIVCASHVSPWPPRAGNEYRLLRLLEHLISEGYRVLLLLAPLPTETISDEQIEELKTRVGNVVVCDRNGGIRYAFASCPDVLAELDGCTTDNYATRLGEGPRQSPRALDLLRIDRTYCHDTVIETALHIVNRLERVALLVQYIWMTRLLPLVDGRIPKILDTIDMYSTKADKVLSFGAQDWALSDAEEARRVARAHLVLAIQDRECALMQELVPSTDVITVGVDFDVPGGATPPDPGSVLIVASGNELNRIGIRDFLRFAWPSVLERVPHATLTVAGQVGRYVPEDAPRVENLGTVDDVTPLYARARVVVNPAAAGTGLKIKTVEALTHNRPIVTWPNGFDGIPDTLRQRLPIPGDWSEFADQVVAYLTAEQPGLDASTQAAVGSFVSPTTAYAALDERLRTLFTGTAIRT
jgi:hypothetical protein